MLATYDICTMKILPQNNLTIALLLNGFSFNIEWYKYVVYVCTNSKTIKVGYVVNYLLKTVVEIILKIMIKANS